MMVELQVGGLFLLSFLCDDNIVKDTVINVN